ncbi:MAG: MFS transporter [Candidatus Lokiarchaeota archaeon]|nr:MFS transporter [Candidatus Lokiarchaeota archaeon]MBD3338673.1 MFS transporter [Candidatus Lokiarchaeota archaeon]
MEKPSELREEKVQLKSRISVSAADASVNFLQTLIAGGALTYYFINIRGLTPILAGIVWLIFGIWNAVNDPLFGYVSDRTKTKLGRRIPYIRYGAPLIATAYILCWIDYPSIDLWPGQTILFIQLLIFLFFYDILYTAVATALYVMPYEMAISNKARGSILIWKLLFSVFSITLPLIIIPLIQPGTNEPTAFYQIFHIIIGVTVGILVFSSTFFYEEKYYKKEEANVPFLESIKNTFKNKSFIIFEVVSFTIIYVQAGLMMGLLFYFDEFTEIPILFLFISLFAGIPVGIILFIARQEKLGVRKTMQIMLLIFSLSCFIILFFGRFLIPTMIGFFGIGMGIVGGFFLIPLMNGDVIDKDENDTGQRREGMYAAINSLITKYAISLAQAVFLFIIVLFGYNELLAPGEQSEMAKTGIIIGWMLMPGLLLFLCFVVMQWYPLYGPKWIAIKAKLAEIHKQKEKEYLEKHGFKYVV